MSPTEQLPHTTREPEIRVAAHVRRAESQSLIDLCRSAFAADEPRSLQYVAHYLNGVFNFSADLLDAHALDGHFKPGDSRDRRRDFYARMGRQLNYLVNRLDESLAPVESGRLIRTVWDLHDGALYHYVVRPGECLVGVALDTASVHRADQAMAALALSVQSSLHRSAPDAGGFLYTAAHRTELEHEREREQEEADRRRSARAGGVPRQRSGSRHTHVPQPLTPLQQDLLGLCAAAVSVQDLHYVAYFRAGDHHFAVDVLDHEKLRPYFAWVGRDERRERYEHIGHRLHFITGRLDHTLVPVIGSRLSRTVLDVEEGAVYYYAVGDGSYLLGVTLDQNRVGRADQRMTHLLADIRSCSAASGAEPGMSE
ncbi:hypothetical protein ABZY90_01140 [Streptomyces sp. NPDC006422]|uniref:hypothetical protein n=1 Tax=unclassified Streptomyces TaxID=2593676 RepID=UPI0033B564C4